MTSYPVHWWRLDHNLTIEEKLVLMSQTQYQEVRTLLRTRPSTRLYVRACSLASSPHFFMSPGLTVCMLEPSMPASRTCDSTSETPSFPARKVASCSQVQVAGSADGGERLALMLRLPVLPNLACWPGPIGTSRWKDRQSWTCCRVLETDPDACRVPSLQSTGL